MEQLYGYAGKILRVDLTRGKITEEALDEETARKYVGGTGLGAKVLYEEVPAGVDWSDEGNRLVLASGPLGGTTVGGSGTVSVVTKGALSNGAVASQANGFFGAFLKFSGFDGMIVEGKAPKWVYLYIHDGQAEIKDASHLQGKDNWETCDLVKKELGAKERAMSVATIGPAGENGVRYAAIFFDKGHTASHNGTGAVMGSKNLKAIAVERGRKRPALKDKQALAAIADQFHEFILSVPGFRTNYEWGTLNGITELTIAGVGIIPVKNYTTGVFEIGREKLEKFWGPYIRRQFKPKPRPCWACRMHHCHDMTLTEGPYKGYAGEEPEYEAFAAFGPQIGNTDSTAAFFLANEADRLGMDCNEAGWTLGLVMECYEKGILTPKDTDGLEMKWGNYQAAHEMMVKIATRQGFGDALAEGAMRAAQRIGGEAPNFAIHTMKGNTPRGHDHRTRWPMLLDTCVSQMSTDEGYFVAKPEVLGISARPNFGSNASAEDALAWNVQCKGPTQFEDCLGVCRFCTRTHIELMAKAITAVTGWDFSPEEGMQVGNRAVNLLRVFNIRHGHTAEMDAPSPRYGSTPTDGWGKGKNIMANWNELRSKYYEGMGWDKETGKPLPDTLQRLGLEDAVDELWKG